MKAKIFYLALAMVMMVALAGIAIPAMAMERAEVVNTGTPLGDACNSSISVTKNIWNGSDLVDTIVASIDESLTFNVTISNTGNCSLTDIWVTDTLSDSLTYNDNATVNGTNREPDILASPDYTWNLSDFAPFEPGGSINISFSANVTSCGVDVNTMTANATDGYDTVYGEDTATVNTPQPSLNVTKQVRLGAGSLADEVIAEINDTVTFNLTIHNTGCCNLTNIMVTDTLPDSLTYNDNAMVNGSLREPTGTPPNYTWNLTDAGVPMLQPNESINISFSANVTSCGVDVNEVTANATCEDNEEYWASGTGDATVNTPCPVGGEVLPIDKVSILAPWLALGTLMVVAMAVLVIMKRRRLA